MNVVPRYTLTMLFFFEVLVFVYFFARGPYGISAIVQSKNVQRQLIDQAGQLERRLALLHDELDQWDRDWFLRERFAREQLGMARPGDLVYVFD